MPTLPHQLGPYRLDEVLGRGGMGVVYAATDQRLGRRVAIKRILGGSENPKQRARLRREARTTAQLDHPSIIRIFDLLEDDEGDWIVMELARGTPLVRLVEEGPLELGPALAYGHRIAEGLAAAHELGIVHRDLKTENVMVLTDGRIKILDFGIAKRLDFVAGGPADTALSKTGQVMGTSRAMSPEQARGMKVGPRSDLFSFGVLLYEILTGVSPFRAASVMMTLVRVVTHQPKRIDRLRPEIPSALAELVERLLRKAPELRPSHAEEVVAALARSIAIRRLESRPRPIAETGSDDGTAQAAGGPDIEATEEVTGEIAGDVEGEITGGVEGAITGEATGHFEEIRDREAAAPQAPDTATPPTRGRGMRSISMAVVALIAAAIFLSPLRAPSGPTLGSEEPRPSDDRLRGDHPTEPESAPADDPQQIYRQAVTLLERIDRPGTVDRAIRLFRGLIEADAASAAAHAGLARAYWEKNRNASAGGDPIYLEQALAMAREAVRLDADLAAARVSLGLVHYAQGRHDQARDELEQALQLDGARADAHYGLGKLTETEGREDVAEAHYRQAIELGAVPFYCDALGALLYEQGRYAEAESTFLRSLELAPDNVHALRNLGVLYYAQGRIDEAATQFQAALEIRPNASLYSNLGTIFFSQGLYSQAAKAFENALGVDGASNRYIFWLNLGDTYRQLPDREADASRAYQRALQILDATIEAGPGDIRLLSRRAVARARSGDRTGALRDIESLRESGTGKDLYSLYRLALAEELCGEREKALASLERAVRAGLPLSEIRLEPDLHELRTDLRFHHLLVALEEES